ncbi:hypothetical protein [Aeromicrobium sp.]|uniref:hypothetical protein n=1 Tax=Aeromicrobium sp. TaxID=1871063 RepID=UPI0019B68D75|nr:hypothetical protein [Aeromicrobium sp.]MBC7630301.1 hypothetical protein [Aeromicrobium sp.]
MLMSSSARRLAAALTATFVAVLLIMTGGTSRPVAPAQRSSAAAGSTAATPHLARTPHIVAASGHHSAPSVPHLDLASAPPHSPDLVGRVDGLSPTDAAVMRLGREHVTPNGRAPPAV